VLEKVGDLVTERRDPAEEDARSISPQSVVFAFSAADTWWTGSVDDCPAG